MSDQHLHIVTHDVPYPADFGGVIDVFYKIKWLHFLGIKIHLHCFLKNRPAQPELEKYCETVQYYKRKGMGSFSLLLPYIVSSRLSKTLLQNLQKDDCPILFEGIHTTYHLSKMAFKNRKLFIRTFNVEHVYYHYLLKNESNFIKKLYYKHAVNVLKKYEKYIANKAHIFALSLNDKIIYQQLFNAQSISFLPVFLPYNQVNISAGKGTYCLYHGNLSINENEIASLWLITQVFISLHIPLIIAGRNPSKKLLSTAKECKFISIVENPTEENMLLLIKNAQINILPSFNKTGVKLKLLNALYNGRHCLVNLAGTDGSGLNELCYIEETVDEFQHKINLLFNEEFSTKEMQRRNTALKKVYNNEQNARLISEMLR